MGNSMGGWTIVMDVGKTHSKATLWDESGACQALRVYANERLSRGPVNLDASGIETWLEAVLREYAKKGPVDAIIPVAHGAGVAVLRGNHLRFAPLDYEWSGVSADRATYDRQRDPFAYTGSPALPAGLNLGVQLHWLEANDSEGLRDVTILPWAQYWAWLLCGVPAAEVTSLGCHSDLWRPSDATPSALCVRRGWADRMAPLTPADQVLGTLDSRWIGRTGLSSRVRVYCGLHDSNAALLDARCHLAMRGHDATMLSTGTWFVAMRSPLQLDKSLLESLPEHRDCLVNVDPRGAAVPSSRFMGGREIELLAGNSTPPANSTSDLDQQIAIDAIKGNRMILPAGVRGVGPFPNAFRAPTDLKLEHPRVESYLYAAMLADVSLDLIGSCDTLLVEGRFAGAPVFVQALAALRPTMKVLIGADDHGVARGALRLAGIGHIESPALSQVGALPVEISQYKSAWREAAERAA
jgi:sugar (pentulose or hexulose) kinase